MLRYEQVKGRKSQFQSIVGMSVSEFELLHNYYEMEWKDYIAHFTLRGEVRSRPHRKRKDSKVEDTHDQLFFMLHYLKSNNLQEHHAAVYEMSQPQANGWLHLLLKLLHKTLKHLHQLPERKAGKMKQVLARLEQVFMDGTERDIQRPAGAEAQREHYSGKKKHTK
jgi:Helix-turn-helix of DDE superfamily endonuclease